VRASLEVADIFRTAGPAYRANHARHLSLHQLKVMSAIEHCRTAALGSHVEACQDCGHRRIAYNSCLMGKSSNGELDWRRQAKEHDQVAANSPLLDLPIRQLMGDAHYLPQSALPEVPGSGARRVA
jgi:hypothetical protein